MLNPSRMEILTAVSKMNNTMKGGYINRTSYTVIEKHWPGGEGISVPRVARSTRNDVNVALHRTVQRINVIREYVCLGSPRTRRRKSQELHGITAAPRHCVEINIDLSRHVCVNAKVLIPP